MQEKETGKGRDCSQMSPPPFFTMLTKHCIFLAGPNFRFLTHPTAGLKTTVIYLGFIHKCININNSAAYNKSPAHSVHFKVSTPSSEVPFQRHEAIIYLKGT